MKSGRLSQCVAVIIAGFACSLGAVDLGAETASPWPEPPASLQKTKPVSPEQRNAPAGDSPGPVYSGAPQGPLSRSAASEDLFARSSGDYVTVLRGKILSGARGKKELVAMAAALIRRYCEDRGLGGAESIRQVDLIPARQPKVAISGRRPAIPAGGGRGVLIAVSGPNHFYFELDRARLRLRRVVELGSGGAVRRLEEIDSGAGPSGSHEGIMQKKWDERGRLESVRERRVRDSEAKGFREIYLRSEKREHGSDGKLRISESREWARRGPDKEMRSGGTAGERNVERDAAGRIIRERSEHAYRGAQGAFAFKHYHDFDYSDSGRLKGESSVSEGVIRGVAFRLEEVRSSGFDASRRLLTEKAVRSQRIGAQTHKSEDIRSVELGRTHLFPVREVRGVWNEGVFDKRLEKVFHRHADGRPIRCRVTGYDGGKMAFRMDASMIYDGGGRLARAEVKRRGYRERREVSRRVQRFSFDQSGRLIKTYRSESGGQSEASIRAAVYEYEGGRLSFLSEKQTDRRGRLHAESVRGFDPTRSPHAFTAFRFMHGDFSSPDFFSAPYDDQKGLRFERYSGYPEEGRDGRTPGKTVRVREFTRDTAGRAAGEIETLAWYSESGELSYVERNRYRGVPEAAALAPFRKADGVRPGGLRRMLVERDDLVYDAYGDPAFHVHQENTYDSAGNLRRARVSANDGDRFVTYEDRYRFDLLGREFSVMRTARGDDEKLLFKDYRKAEYDRASRLMNYTVRIDGPRENIDAAFQSRPGSRADDAYVQIEGHCEGPAGTRKVDVTLRADFAPFWLYSTEEMVELMEALSQVAGEPVR